MLPLTNQPISRTFVEYGPQANRHGLRSESGLDTEPFDKGVSMRFIPTKFHAPLDYIVGAALIAAPWVFQFSEHTAATIVPVVLGIGLIAYSLFTNYELGVWKVAPMAVHNVIDIVAGAVLALSPWIFGFADESANVWVPHLTVGLAAIFLGLTTKQAGGYSYGRNTARTAA
jgi:SPW repeat-containing protein